MGEDYEKEIDAGWLVGLRLWNNLSHVLPSDQQPSEGRTPCAHPGRSYDLTSAYKQLCVSKRSSKFANVAVFCPEKNRTSVFKQLCLPFGSRASVNGFIRCSRCIQWIALRCLVLPLTSYYDDFLAASSSVALAKNTEDSMSMLFQLLGWKYDVEGPKADVFSDSVSALGVLFDLGRTHEGVVIVDNTCKRKKDLDKLIANTLRQGSLDHRRALELRGKLAFADAQVMSLQEGTPCSRSLRIPRTFQGMLVP